MRNTKRYNPYTDKNNLIHLNERKTGTSSTEKKESFLTKRQLEDLEFTPEDGKICEDIPITKISIAEKERMIKERRGAGVNFHDPYGFTDGFRQ